MPAKILRFPQTPTGRFVRLTDLLDARGLEAMNLPILATWSAWQRAQGHSEHTIKARVRRVEIFATMIGDPELANTDDVITYMASLPTGVSKSTRATYFSHLRAWFAWLVKTGKRDDDPCARVTSPRSPRREPRPITEEQFRRVLAVPMRRRTRMMVLLAAFQGLRAHEIAKFRGEDIDHVAGQLTVKGKGEVTKVLPLHEVVAEYARGFPERGYWFAAQGGHEGHIHARSVTDAVSGVLRRAGVPTGAAHRLRHTYATRLVQGGQNLRVVQELLRHASLQTTQIYTGVTFDQQQAAIASLSLP